MLTSTRVAKEGFLTSRSRTTMGRALPAPKPALPLTHNTTPVTWKHGFHSRQPRHPALQGGCAISPTLP